MSKIPFKKSFEKKFLKFDHDHHVCAEITQHDQYHYKAIQYDSITLSSNLLFH